MFAKSSRTGNTNPISKFISSQKWELFFQSQFG